VKKKKRRTHTYPSQHNERINMYLNKGGGPRRRGGGRDPRSKEDIKQRKKITCV